MTISNIKTYGLAESIYASGYPMMNTAPTEEIFNREVELIERSIRAMINGRASDNSHIKRMTKLGNTQSGSGHGQALIGCIVQFDLCFPIKAWTELQRYHFIDFVSSMSTMHRLKDFALTSENIDKHVDSRIIEILNELQDKYNENPTKVNMLALLMNAPVGINLTARMTTNYAQLKTIYNQRKPHRLPVWQEFCDFCDELPLFNLLTGCDRK